MTSQGPAAHSSNRSGVLLIDKPGGLTSHDVVAMTRRAAGTRKVGHAGTLDPMATGLLVLGVNSSTRLLTYVVGLDKEYEATIRLGASTSTDDAEGEVLQVADAAAIESITRDEVLAALSAQTGAIMQRPSSVSAIKVDGRRAYARVRLGETVVLDARAVTVASIELLATRAAALADGSAARDVDVRVSCSSGTYIRAIARDVGEQLGVGGHLAALRRTRIGPFLVADAHAIDSLDPETALLSPASVAAELFTVVHLGAQAAADLRNGKKIPVDGAPKTTYAAVDPQGELIGLFEVRGGVARVLVNFPPDPLESSAVVAGADSDGTR